MKFSTVLVTAASLTVALPAAGQNLVTNGDFSAGNSGFSSSYTYSPGGGGAADVYTVGTNPQSWNGYFVSAGDHTTGSGQMMIVNGGPTANAIVWQSSAIAISALTSYNFEAFVLNAYPQNPPNLTFTVSLDGGPEQVLNTLTVPLTTGVWNGLSTNFNSGAATTATLFLRNAQTAYSGNDFAIDDIYLGTGSIVNSTGVPEPATWGMLVIGFGAVGAALRGRRGHQPRIRFV